MFVSVRLCVVGAVALSLLAACTAAPPPTISLGGEAEPPTESAPTAEAEEEAASTPRPTSEATTEATQEPTAEPTATRVPVDRVSSSGVVDPCALTSQEEITKILGGYQEPVFNPETGLCLYSFGTGRSQKAFWIGAGSGAEGKRTLYVLMNNIVNTLDSGQATAALSGVRSQVDNTAMLDLTRLFAIILNMTDMEMTELASPGDTAYFFWLNDFDGQPMAQFLAVDNETYVVMLFIGQGFDPEETQATATWLAEDILDQLPKTFTVSSSQ